MGLSIGVLAAAFGVLMWATFDGVREMTDRERLGSVVRVVDGYVSCFVVDDGAGGVFLIDTCNSEDAAPVVVALREFGHAPGDVGAILLTHGHPDHRQGIGRFRAARVYAHRDELPLLRGAIAAHGPIPRLSGRQVPVEVDQPLDDGDRFTLGQRAITVFHLPGHTDGSVAYLVDDTLFLGDNAHAMDDGTLEPAPWVFSDDTSTNRASLRALAARLSAGDAPPIARLVFGHSGALDSPNALTRWAAANPE